MARNRQDEFPQFFLRPVRVVVRIASIMKERNRFGDHLSRRWAKRRRRFLHARAAAAATETATWKNRKKGSQTVEDEVADGARPSLKISRQFQLGLRGLKKRANRAINPPIRQNSLVSPASYERTLTTPLFVFTPDLFPSTFSPRLLRSPNIGTLLCVPVLGKSCTK